jgi:hypothetical protein
MRSTFAELWPATFRFVPKLLILGGAALAIIFGLRMSHAPNTLEAFAGVFLVVSGAQIALWVLGIRLEMLGNTSNDPQRASQRAFVAGESVDEGLLRLEGKMLTWIGLVMGQASIDSIDPLKVLDEVKLAEAVSWCQRGYEMFRKIGDPSEFMALNNLVFYSSVLGNKARRHFLLEKARILQREGEVHNSLNLLLTACYAILRFEDDPREKAQAIETLRGIQYSYDATDQEKREASLYLAHFTEEYVKMRIGTQAGN